MVGSATLHEFFWSRARKSFSPLICEYLDWRRPKVPVLKREKKSHTDPSLIRRVGFWETGGDRTLVQQAISLPGGRITHKWTDCIAKKKKKKNIPPFQVVPTGFSLHCSLLLSFSLLLWPHIFFVCPAGNELLSRLLPPFLPLVSFFYSDWQVRILVKVGCLSLPFFLSLLFFFFFLSGSFRGWAARVMAAVDHCAPLITVSLWRPRVTAKPDRERRDDDVFTVSHLPNRDSLLFRSLVMTTVSISRSSTETGDDLSCSSWSKFWLHNEMVVEEWHHPRTDWFPYKSRTMETRLPLATKAGRGLVFSGRYPQVTMEEVE